MGGGRHFGSELTQARETMTNLKKRPFSGMMPDANAEEEFSDLYSDSFERRDLVPEDDQFAAPA